jgi:transposase
LARERANPIAELAKDLRIRESCLRNWVAQANADERGSQTRLIRDEKKELAQPQRRNNDLDLLSNRLTFLKRSSRFSAIRLNNTPTRRGKLRTAIGDAIQTTVRKVKNHL